MISLMINKCVLLRVFEPYFSHNLLAYTYDWDLNDFLIYFSLVYVFKGFFYIYVFARISFLWGSIYICSYIYTWDVNFMVMHACGWSWSWSTRDCDRGHPNIRNPKGWLGRNHLISTIVSWSPVAKAINLWCFERTRACIFHLCMYSRDFLAIYLRVYHIYEGIYIYIYMLHMGY